MHLCLHGAQGNRKEQKGSIPGSSSFKMAKGLATRYGATSCTWSDDSTGG